MDMPQIQASSRAAHFMFAAWAVAQKDLPTPEQIMDSMHVSYNSATAWRRDWINVRAWLTTGEWPQP